MANKLYCGWDVGGAHLKAALLDAEGHVLRVLQLPCALWLGLDMLQNAIDQILLDFYASTKNAPLRHGVTMTGELVDLFANRQEGVQEISRTMHEKLGEQAFFFCAHTNKVYDFVDYAAVNQHWPQIASANWLASASLIAKHMGTGLFIDMGSTTTDFVLLHHDKPQCLGFSDAARLASKELVYTGVVRTPLMALCQEVIFQGKPTGIAAEYFATTADVYRLLGELPTDEDMADTADGKDKSTVATARRIARMIGCDAEDAALEDWHALARNFKQLQLAMLQEAALQQIARLKKLATDLDHINIIGAGAGQFLLKALVEILNQQQTTMTEKIQFQYIDCGSLMLTNMEAENAQQNSLANWATICLPAVAAAKLAFDQFQ